MKKWIAILLIISLICSLSACSNSMKSTETLNEETPSAESVPSSTPVSTSTEISDIDFSLLGLSDLETTYAMEAYSQGISWKELYDNPDDDISMKDMLALIKNADRLFFGDDKSNFLNWFSYEENEKATRIRAAEIIYNRQMERVFNIESSGDAFYEEKDDKINSIESSWIQFPYASLVGKCSDGTIGEFFLWEDCLDLDIIDAVGDSSAVNYVIKAFNKKTGAKLMALDEKYAFNPNDAISKKEAILIAYNYFYSIEPDPVYVSVDDVGTYDKQIITDDLLNQPITLPEATNEKLPAWKGFNIGYMPFTAWCALGCTEEDWRTEAEIKTIASTGANFIRLWTSFSRYEAPAYDSDQINTYYLEHLDQIIAWGMKYGVHIQLSITEGAGLKGNCTMQEATEKTNSIFTDTAYKDQMLKWYRMIARRYADIPNNYFSINLMNECDPVDDNNYAETFAPIVSAIWEEAPSRVIVADVHSDNITGESMAKLGVALSYHLYRPIEVCVVNADNIQNNPDFYTSMTWPYKGIDGAAMMDIAMGLVSLNDVKAIADENHVGFMVGEFGIFESKGGTCFTTTIPRDTVYAMLQDVIDTMDERGIPWASNWVENYSVAISYPINTEANYEKIENSTFYMDTVMFDFFKKNIEKKQ